MSCYTPISNPDFLGVISVKCTGNELSHPTLYALGNKRLAFCYSGVHHKTKSLSPSATLDKGFGSNKEEYEKVSLVRETIVAGDVCCR